MESKNDFGLSQETRNSIDKEVQRLRGNQATWANLPLKNKIDLLKETILAVHNCKAEYVKLVTVNKKTTTPEREWISFAYPVGVVLNGYIDALQNAAQAEESGQTLTTDHFQPPYVPQKVNDQFRVQIVPHTRMQAMALPGVSAEIFVQKGKDFSCGAEFLKNYNNKEGGLSLILVAGNQTSIGLLDCIDKLYHCNQVTVLKHNPVNGWVLPIYDQILAPFIKRGFACSVSGGIPEGSYLIELVDEIHITGSDKTHDAIVWGKTDKTDPSSSPICKKPITSELGCVTPNIIVPGPYSRSDLIDMANNIVGTQADNCGFNCNSPKLIVTCKNWPQRSEFLSLLRQSYSSLPPVFAYYPGASDRWNKFRNNYPQAEEFGEGSSSPLKLPWLFIPDVPPQKEELALQMEPWAPVLSETSLDCPPGDFLPLSVNFCNEAVWGNLSASIYIHPKTEEEKRNQFEKALADLRYGGIAVNQWSATVYSNPLPWGAFPGNTEREIVSGIGFVHNTFFVDNVEKSVIRFPFHMTMGARMHYYAGCKNPEGLASALADFGLYPSLWNLGKVFYNITFN